MTFTSDSTEMGRSLLTVNVGGEYTMGKNRGFTVFGGYDGQAVLDRNGGFMHTGHVGGAVRW